MNENRCEKLGNIDVNTESFDKEIGSVLTTVFTRF